ncbi:hypothetical protein GGR57DRAFT_520251 [Xylariaceae sp. FL1272]|nr:hypothetical protein GGR57DRAFT_520251 [Xylariaceae sp. FL1272]
MPLLFFVKSSIITVLVLAQPSFASCGGGGSPFDKRECRRNTDSVSADKLVSMIGHVSGLLMQPVNPQDLSNRTKHRSQAQQSFSSCKEGLEEATVHFSSPLTGNLLVSGVPPACMTLAGTMFGDGKPIPVGPESLLFQNVDETYMMALQAAIDAHV